MVWAFSRLAFGRPEWGDTFLTLQLLNIKVFPFVVKEELITSSVCKILGWSILIQLFAKFIMGDILADTAILANAS